MADEPISRGKAIAWLSVLYFLSVLANLSVFWLFKKTYQYNIFQVFLGHVLYTIMFVCAWSMGTRADAEDLKKSVGDGFRTIIQPAPHLALVFFLCLLVALFVLKWSWTWRAVAPLACGIIAGVQWARQETGGESKPGREESPQIDIWKP